MLVLRTADSFQLHYCHYQDRDDDDNHRRWWQELFPDFSDIIDREEMFTLMKFWVSPPKTRIFLSSFWTGWKCLLCAHRSEVLPGMLAGEVWDDSKALTSHSNLITRGNTQHYFWLHCRDFQSFLHIFRCASISWIHNLARPTEINFFQ